jgi:hypothetical protein
VYDSLGLLFGAYFHQDFSLVHGTPDDTVRAFREAEPHQVVGAVAEIDDLIDGDRGEADLRSLLDDLGSCYRIEADGYTARAWLAHVRALLTETVDDAP